VALERRRPVRPLQCQPPTVPAKPLAAAAAARDVVGPRRDKRLAASTHALAISRRSDGSQLALITRLESGIKRCSRGNRDAWILVMLNSIEH
jgi:hypothetical protein